MQVTELQKKLLAAAKSAAPSDRVPYAFEKRIMARIAALPKPDAWALWGSALWRGAAACVALTLVVGALALVIPEQTAANDGEHTVALSMDPAVESSNELQ